MCLLNDGLISIKDVYMKIIPYDLSAEILKKTGPSGNPVKPALIEKFSNILKVSLEKNRENESKSNGTAVEYIVKPGDTLWKIGVQLFQEDPYKIAKDNGIADPDLIFPGQKLMIYKSQGKSKGAQKVVASWYGEEYHNKPTASGERFDMHKNTLAHKTLPLGTTVRLINPENGQMAVGKINDRGPFIKGRDLDLSYSLATQLGFVKKGVGKLTMEIL